MVGVRVGVRVRVVAAERLLQRALAARAVLLGGHVQYRLGHLVRGRVRVRVRARARARIGVKVGFGVGIRVGVGVGVGVGARVRSGGAATTPSILIMDSARAAVGGGAPAAPG